MFKYLVQGSYTAEGTKGLIKDGGSARKEAIAKMASSLGGSLEALFYSTVSPTYFVIMNMPDKTTAAAIGATIVASGAVTITASTELLTPAEMDEVVKKTPSYRAPGH